MTKSPWDRIADSALADTYLTELYWLARDVADACDALFRDVTVPDGSDSYLRVDHQVHRSLFRILSDAAHVRLLLADRPQRGVQPDEQYSIQVARVEWLRARLAGLTLKAIFDPALRDGIEHFDERLDQVSLASLRGDIPRPTLFALDMIVGRKGTLEGLQAGGRHPTVYPLRIYYAREQQFSIGDREIDIAALGRECRAIAGRLNGSAEPERGGTIAVITDASFEN